MHLAASTGHSEVVGLLLEVGADLQAKDEVSSCSVPELH